MARGVRRVFLLASGRALSWGPRSGKFPPQKGKQAVEKGTNKTELGLTDFQIKDLFSDNLPTHNVHRLKREKI